MSTRQKLEKKEYIPKAWESISCPFCNDTEYKLLEKFGNSLQYAYVICKNCTLVYLNPRPLYDNDFVYDAYEFYAEEDNRYIIDDTYYEKKGKFEKNEVQEVIKFDNKRTYLLDIGCAVGKFLFHAKPYYKKCLGLDVSSLMAETIKDKIGIDVINENFETWDCNEKFSCIHMSHVLEHFPYPKLWIDKAKSLLEPDGILVISVPNMFSIDRRIKRLLKKIGLTKNNWESWRTPDHLFEPTIPAMHKFIKNNELTIIEHHTYSRKKLDINSLLGKLYHKYLKLGSNMRYILQVQKD